MKMKIQFIVVECLLILAFLVIGFLSAVILLDQQEPHVIIKPIEVPTSPIIHNYSYHKSEYISSDQLNFIIDWIQRHENRRNKAPSVVCAKSPRLQELPKVTGWSMTPRFDQGDIPLGKPYNIRDHLVEGDDILYNYDNIKVLHSVCGIYPDYVSTCSINLDVRHKINYTDIEYVVCGVKRG